MVSKERPLPRYTGAHLADGMRSFLRSGPLGSYTDKSVGFDRTHDVDMSEGRVLFRYFGAVQVIEFKEEKNGVGKTSFNCHVYNIGTNSAEQDKVREYIGKRLDGLSQVQKTRVARVFGGELAPLVEQGQVKFRGEDKDGVVVRIPIPELPRGKHGSLSGDLYEMIFNAFMLPANRVMIHQQCPRGDVWYRFPDVETDLL